MAGTDVATRTTEHLLHNRRLPHYALLSLLVATGAALRIYDLGAESYWIDEVSMLNVVGGDAESIIADFLENGRPPVYVWLARGWVGVFGTGEAAARSLSAAFGIAAIVAMYVVGRQLFGPWIGLTSAAFLTFSQVQIYHAQNFRYYSLMVFLTLASFFFYNRALRSGGYRNFAWWVCASLVLFYTHSLAVFVFPAQTLHSLLVLRRQRAVLVPWLVSQTVLYAAPVAHLALPLLVETVVNRGPVGGPSWIPSVTPMMVVLTLREYVFAGVTLRLLVIGSAALLGLLAAYWVWLGGGTFRRLLQETAGDLARLADKRHELALVIAWLVLPIAVPFVLSVVLKPMYVSRYTLTAAPAFYLLAAMTMWTARRLIPPVPALVFLGLLVAPGLYAYYAQPSNEQWREVAAHVTSSAHPDDAVMLFPARFEEGWYWYFERNLHQCRRGEEFAEPLEFVEALDECMGERRRVWIVMRDTSLVSGFISELSDLLERPGLQHLAFRYMRLYLVTPPGWPEDPVTRDPTSD